VALLGPDANSRTIYLGPGQSAWGRTATVYTDSAATSLATILTYDGTGTPGAAISGSALTIDSESQVPQFWFPVGVDTLYARVNGLAAVKKLNADYDARLDAAHYASTDAQWLLNGSPTGVLRPNLRRSECGGNLAALTTQIMTSVALYLEAGDVVTNLTFCSATTAAGTPTNWWYALYSTASTPALLGQTADQATTAWAANTVKTLALASPYTVLTTGVYYAAVHVKATTVPTLLGASLNANASAAVVTGQKVLAMTSGSGLTDAAPATIATPTTVATVPYCVAT
jgi:hypothetical protein